MPNSYMDWTEDEHGRWVWDPERSPGELFYSQLIITPDRRIVWEMQGKPIWEVYRPEFSTRPIDQLQWTAISELQKWAYHTGWKAGGASLNIPYSFCPEGRRGGDPAPWVNFFGFDVISVAGFQIAIHTGSNMANPSFPEWALFHAGDFPSSSYITIGAIPAHLTPVERRQFALSAAANYLSNSAQAFYRESSTPTAGMEPPTELPSLNSFTNSRVEAYDVGLPAPPPAETTSRFEELEVHD